jgi:hypothetical protein
VLLPVRRGTHSGREGHAMDDTEPLGPGNESWLASIVADGTATKDDATRLLVEFVRQANAGQVSPRMIEHLRDCFAAFLVGKKRILPSRDAGRDAIVSVPIKSMEKAFGLVRISSGQPPIDADTLTEAAADLLEQRVAGTSHQDALANVAENRKAAGLQVTSETEIGAAWAKHKLDALIWLRACLKVAMQSQVQSMANVSAMRPIRRQRSFRPILRSDQTLAILHVPSWMASHGAGCH